jgi:hypothetical protein
MMATPVADRTVGLNEGTPVADRIKSLNEGILG